MNGRTGRQGFPQARARSRAGEPGSVATTDWITRAEIIARAQTWASAPRPYSQQECDPVSGYRLDCSGFTAMVWRLDPPGLTTVELPELCEPIEIRDLRAGDAVMLGGPGTEGDAGHAIVFDAWAGAWFRAFEQIPTGTTHHVRPFPESPPYRAYRYRMVWDG
jgi:hypothetical protein